MSELTSDDQRGVEPRRARTPGAEGRPAKGRDFGLRHLISVFHSPSRTFGELARSPTIAAALIATALTGAIAATASMFALDADAQILASVEDRLATSQFARELSDADRQELQETARKTLALTNAFIPVMTALSAVVLPLTAAAFFLLAFGVLGDKGSFRSILSVLLHANWPANVAGMLLAGAVAWLSYPVPLERAGTLPGTSVANWFGLEIDSAIGAVTSRLDLRLAWQVVLAGIGFSIALGISRRRSFAVVIALWGLGTLLLVGLVLFQDSLGLIPGRLHLGP